MAEPQSEEKSRDRPVPMVLESITLNSLNTFITDGNDMLEKLKHQILAASKQNDSQWEQRFIAAEGTPVKPSTTVGVIGSTGSGKSSVLNAILDQEVLLPQSCMQACTATVIEIAWNESTEHEIIAEVCFVDAEAWRFDIGVALKDAAAFTGSLNDDTTEAGMAFKKITAVYPWVNKTNIKQITVDELMEAPEIQQLLNTTLELRADDAKQMHDYLTKYVEGKEKLQDKFFDNGDPVSAEVDTIEYWPMVAKVRIFIKSFVLETGIVIADLPGVGDSNAARGNVAQNYLGRCANIWIVTPISRAVDDKVARNLLGESFKRQLRRDGIVSKVAFVCSKADELVINELRNRLRLSPDFMKSIYAISQERTELQEGQRLVEASIQEDKESISTQVRRIEEIRSEKSDYMRLRKLAKDGEVVHPVAPRRSKRAATKSGRSPNKQSKILEYMYSQPSSIPAKTNVDEEDDDTGMDSDTSYKEVKTAEGVVEQDKTQAAMTVPEIDAKIKALREEEREIGESKHALREKVQENKLDLETYATKLQKLADREWNMYYQGRNTYCRQTIRVDFANGLRDLEDAEAQFDEDEYDPEAAAEQAEGVQLQEDLPVFCVSAQGFQKLRGRLQGEKITSKFTYHQQTGIPELLMHCHGLGQSDLRDQFYKYAEGANNLITSVRFWLTGPSNAVAATVTYSMQDVTDDMLADIAALAKEAFSDVNNMVLSRVVSIFEDGAQEAQDKALSIVEEWTDPHAAALKYQTYRAVVRRGGSFSKPFRTLNFAGDLLKPLLTCIDGVWNSVFNERIPRRLHDLRKSIKQRIAAYVDSFDQNPEFLAVSSNTAEKYQQQVARFRSDLVRSVDEIAVSIKLAQQETNRLFAGNVQEELKAICEVLDNDSGVGVFGRIKQGMRTGIADIKERMFDESIKAVENKLLADLEDLIAMFETKIEVACKESSDDCRRLFARKIRGGKSISPKHKAAIQEVLEEAERFFEIKGISPGEAVEESPKEPTASQREVSMPIRSSVARNLGNEEETRFEETPRKSREKESSHGGDENDGSSLVLSDGAADDEGTRVKQEVPDWGP